MDFVDFNLAPQSETEEPILDETENHPNWLLGSIISAQLGNWLRTPRHSRAHHEIRPQFWL